MIFFKKKRIELGEGHIIQYTIFENKKFGGIWIYNWKTVKQNRYHTHAFASYAFLLNGSYIESQLINSKPIINRIHKRFKPRYLPKDYTHKILMAEPNTWTIVFFGKWKDHWWEYFEDTKTWIQYGWGRKILKRTKQL